MIYLQLYPIKRLHILKHTGVNDDTEVQFKNPSQQHGRPDLWQRRWCLGQYCTKQTSQEIGNI